MKTVEYAHAFNYTLQSGIVFHVAAGEQEVPDEIADSPIAQFNQVDVPDDVALAYVPPYGSPGHLEHEFMKNRGVPKSEMPNKKFIEWARRDMSKPVDARVEDRSLAVQEEGTIQSAFLPDPNNPDKPVAPKPKHLVEDQKLDPKEPPPPPSETINAAALPPPHVSTGPIPLSAEAGTASVASQEEMEASARLEASARSRRARV